MRNLRLDLCYDGTRYRGFQRLSDTENTIQGKLEAVLTRLLDEPVSVSGSGRTDAGVHAAHQIVSFHCRSGMDRSALLDGLRRYLPEDIGVYSCVEAPERFHARLNARQKAYRYRIWNSTLPCVFERRFVAVRPEALDTAAMEQAAACFLGEHDFSAFCSQKPGKKSTVRRIDALTLERKGPELQITVTGNGFLYNMVRILVGTLLEVGDGQRNPDSIPALFGGKRAQAGFLAPPQGLCLMEVTY